MIHRRTALVLIATALTFGCPRGASGQDPAPTKFQEFVESFKLPKTSGLAFNLTSVRAEKFVKHEPEGLRITLPTGTPGDGPSMGVISNFGIKGDFELTLNYDILKEPNAAELQKYAFGLEDVREIRVTGTTGGDKAELDVRVTELRIAAAAFPKSFVPPPPPPLKKAPPPRDLAQRVEVKFREEIDAQPLMRVFGPGAREMMKIDAQGMRFPIPAMRKANLPVGVESQLRLRGDFEITFAYELLALPNPPPPLGAGVDLWVKFDMPNNVRAQVSRNQKPEGAFFGSNIITVGRDGKDSYHRLALRGAKEPKGQLRLVRVGKMLSLQIADGAADFLVLATKEFGDQDVVGIRVQGQTGWQTKSGVDVRLISLDIRADQMPKSARSFAENIEFPLKDGVDKQPSLRFAGPDAASMAKVDAQGLRFSIPADRDSYKDLGVESALRLRGDFEITLHYDLLALPEPPAGVVTGVVLQIHLDTSDRFKARLSHVKSNENYRYGANFLTTGNDGKEIFKGITVQPGKSNVRGGALRFARTGKTLSYQISDSPAGFMTIATKDVGTADVILTQALGNTGWKRELGIDIRFNSLDLHADQTREHGADPSGPVVAALPAPAHESTPSRSWLVALLIIGAALIATFAGAIALRLLLGGRYAKL